MASPPHQDGPAPTPVPAYQTGSAPAPTLDSSSLALLCGGAAVPTLGGQSGNPLGDLFLYTRLLKDPC
jgi:hypothetical protein